jgi:hypothetical protein
MPQVRLLHHHTQLSITVHIAREPYSHFDWSTATVNIDGQPRKVIDVQIVGKGEDYAVELTLEETQEDEHRTEED